MSGDFLHGFPEGWAPTVIGLVGAVARCTLDDGTGTQDLFMPPLSTAATDRYFRRATEGEVAIILASVTPIWCETPLEYLCKRRFAIYIK